MEWMTPYPALFNSYQDERKTEYAGGSRVQQKNRNPNLHMELPDAENNSEGALSYASDEGD